MSQAKVDQYKKEKVNRKETLAKEKRQRMVTKICGSVEVLAIVAWMGVSIVTSIYGNRPQDTVYVNMDEIDSYLDSINPEETTEHDHEH